MKNAYRTLIFMPCLYEMGGVLHFLYVTARAETPNSSRPHYEGVEFVQRAILDPPSVPSDYRGSS